MFGYNALNIKTIPPPPTSIWLVYFGTGFGLFQGIRPSRFGENNRTMKFLSITSPLAIALLVGLGLGCTKEPVPIKGGAALGGVTKHGGADCVEGVTMECGMLSFASQQDFTTVYDCLEAAYEAHLDGFEAQYGYLSEDGNQLVFASDRPGGFGGLDLYISRKLNGDWGSAINLGPQVNTQFNEDRPFLINKGKTLYFSSQGHRNMGGYDLFRSELQPNNLWSQPENLGYPLNTPDDNIFFMPADNGNSGYISRYRESDGSGREDIYRITFK